jgi:hypothetical protein
LRMNGKKPTPTGSVSDSACFVEVNVSLAMLSSRFVMLMSTLEPTRPKPPARVTVAARRPPALSAMGALMIRGSSIHGYCFLIAGILLEVVKERGSRRCEKRGNTLGADRKSISTRCIMLHTGWPDSS